MRQLPRSVAAAGALAVLLAGATITSSPAGAGNPIVTQIYTADPAALVHDGTFYLYTGRDEATTSQQNFVMRQWRVFSSDDMVNWTDHGSPLSVDSFSWANADAWASEVVQGTDGRFYWYVSVNGFTDPGWMNIGVAVAGTPLGPFTDAIGGPLISDSTPGSASLNIDPTTFVDDNGEVYLYWGSFWQPRMVRLGDDMVSLDGPVTTPQGLTDFWEAPWLFKRDGAYYMAYASNSGAGCVTSSSFACIRYATASNPLGPWTHRGIVLGQVSSTTNHPAIVQFHDQWYMVYHTADAPGGGNFRRSVAIDKLFFNANGTMQLVQQTAHGVDPVGTNLGLAATASTSHVSPWETLAAVNDGAIPLDSADRGDGVYGNWPEQGTQWVQYDWTSPRTIDRIAAYWFDDNLGIDLPATCQVQYRTGAGTWAPVPGQTACGVAGDQYQLVHFPAVTTTGLRLQITSRPGFSTGLIELMAFAPLPGTS